MLAAIESVISANGSAPTANHAFFLIKCDLAGSGKRFGVVTPLAAKRTALEKHGSANPRAVVDAKSLNVENINGHSLSLMSSTVDYFILKRLA